MKKEVIRFENIHCSQDNQTYINGLFFRAFQGQTCCVIVNNIMQKKYFLQLLSGKLKPSYGWTYFKGKKIISTKMQEQIYKQISFIDRKKGIFTELSVAENIFLPNHKIHWWNCVKNHFIKDALLLMEDLDITLPMQKKANLLDYGFQKQIELLRAYISGRHLVVITDMEIIMTEDQLAYFFNLVDKLKKRGMTFIYVVNSSTKLYEYADEITIMKKGRTIGHMNQENFSTSQTYIELFEKTKKYSFKKTPLSVKKVDKKVVLEFRNLKLPDLPILNLSLLAGEVLTILDIDSIECRNIIPILKGECEFESGRILLNGSDYLFHSLHQSIQDGIAFIEAKPLKEMLFMDMTVLDNLLIMLQQKKKDIFIKKKYKKMIYHMLNGIFEEEELEEKVYKVSDECKLKLLYYRWILVRPQVLVCIKPFSSVDFQMRSITIHLLKEVQKSGIAIVIITNQIAEAYTIQGNNITFHNGVITYY